MRFIEYLKTLRYPGRFIVVGKMRGAVIGIYGAMGRSPSSLARAYIMDEHKDVRAVGTDRVVLNEGNPQLLEYRSLRWLDNGFVIANGRQIEGGWESCDPEPDEYHTSRITAVVGSTVEFFISRMTLVGVERKRWPLALEDGVGHFISTYAGADVRPTPSFVGDPVRVSLDFGSPGVAAMAVFDALTPEYRVGVVSVAYDGQAREVAICNKL
jgi:IMP cyclohydrolase